MRNTIISSVFVLLFPQFVSAPGTASRIFQSFEKARFVVPVLSVYHPTS
jgi:hypothetical protein